MCDSQLNSLSTKGKTVITAIADIDTYMIIHIKRMLVLIICNVCMIVLEINILL